MATKLKSASKPAAKDVKRPAAGKKKSQAALPPPAFNLGERVKGLRLEKGLTLGDAAERSGLARSTLSKIENGKSSPTFEVMQKVASGLAIAMDELLAVRRVSPPAGRRSITRVNQGQHHDTGAYTHEFLCTDLTHKNTVPSKARINARSVTDFPDWIRHDGDDFLIVLEGEIELHTEFYQPVKLQTGDSAYFDARMGHFCISTSEANALVLWVPTHVEGAADPYGTDRVRLPYL